MSANTPSPSRPTLDHLIPEHISKLLGERPILFYEDAAQYDALLAEFVAGYDAKDTQEFFLIRDLADAQWEMTRFRQLRKAAIEAELPKAASYLIENDYRNMEELSYSDARDGLRIMVRKAAQGDADMREALDHYSREAGVTYRMMEYEAISRSMKSMAAIEDGLARAERRRDQLIRMIEDRRRNLAAMSRGLVDRAGAAPAIEATATGEAA